MPPQTSETFGSHQWLSDRHVRLFSSNAGHDNQRARITQLVEYIEADFTQVAVPQNLTNVKLL